MRQRRAVGSTETEKESSKIKEGEQLMQLVTSERFAYHQKAAAVLLCSFLMLLLLAIIDTIFNRASPELQFRRTQYEAIRPPIDDAYDVFNCPNVPPANYPRDYKVMDVLGNWSVDDIERRDSRTVHQGICVFDYLQMGQDAVTERVSKYQKAEVPFVVRNDPMVMTAVRKWKQTDYLRTKLRGKRFEATLSNTTHMTYFTISSDTILPDSFVPPTRFAPMSFDEWYRRAEHPDTAIEYAYLRLDACLPHEAETNCDATYQANTAYSGADFIYEDLRFFHPDENTQYIVDATKPRGIQCRFGAPGLIAENHFDNERNYIAMLGGERRYLLSHPGNCPHMYLHSMGHPSERHSKVNWSQPDLDRYPDFRHTRINEVVLQAGDVLYLPTYWFHHIVSLTTNYQCNTRSGYSVEYDQLIYDCGFYYDFPE